MTKAKKGRKPKTEKSSDNLVAEFVGAVKYILMPYEFKGTALHRFVIKFARQWHISDSEVDDIIIEGVKRGVEYIQKNGKPINKPEAWLRPVYLNIMKDRVKAAIKDEQKSKDMTSVSPPSKSPLLEVELIEQLGYLDKALKALSREDQVLIRMKFLRNKTYDQIQYHYKLASEGDPVPSIVTLRKRVSRALEKLKFSFFELYEEEVEASR
ncbi:MAG: sigma-70 family RNA polymerase sigma factor [Bacteroidota bacterium]